MRRRDVALRASGAPISLRPVMVANRISTDYAEAGESRATLANLKTMIRSDTSIP